MDISSWVVKAGFAALVMHQQHLLKSVLHVESSFLLVVTL